MLVFPSCGVHVLYQLTHLLFMHHSVLSAAGTCMYVYVYKPFLVIKHELCLLTNSFVNMFIHREVSPHSF